MDMPWIPKRNDPLWVINPDLTLTKKWVEKYGSDSDVLYLRTVQNPCLQVVDGQPPEWLEGTDVVLRGESLTRNIGEFPNVARESSLSQILQDNVPEKYFLSSRACQGILRRAEKRGKKLPPVLEMALKAQSR